MTAAARLSQPIRPISFDDFTAAAGAGERPELGEPAGSRIKYARNEEIFGEGDSADSIYRIQSGTVRLYRLLSDGRRQIGAFYFVGQAFGMERDNEHRLSAEAVTNCEVVAIPRQMVFRHAERSPAYARRLWDQAAADLAEARDHMLLLGRQSATERVASFLLAMESRNIDRGVIALPMSRQDIADYLGLTIETVSRTLSLLEDKGVLEIKTPRDLVVRNAAALQRLHS